METYVFHLGPCFTVEAAMLANGESPARDFVEALSDGERAKVLALFRLLGDTGRIKNVQKFKKIEGSSPPLWEFKSFQVRMPCFFMPGQRVVVTHGFKKKKDKIPASEVAKAQRIRDEHASRGGAKK